VYKSKIGSLKSKASASLTLAQAAEEESEESLCSPIPRHVELCLKNSSATLIDNKSDDVYHRHMPSNRRSAQLTDLRIASTLSQCLVERRKRSRT
jgi:hypothetical protein